jgi:multidrug efflux pump
MKVSFFIDRPVFSAVISIVIVIVGIIGLTMLPVDQYPQITPPVVKISASYPGASALTVSQAVATPIEQEINGTPGMLYMESNSSNSGGFSATVTFDVSADPDLAAVEIQNRIKLAESRLPAEVIQNGISVEKHTLQIAFHTCTDFHKLLCTYTTYILTKNFHITHFGRFYNNSR